MLRPFLAAAAAAALLAACAPPSGSHGPVPRARAVAPNAPISATGSVAPSGSVTPTGSAVPTATPGPALASPAASGAAGASKPGPPIPTADPTSFACRTTRCQSGTETCCANRKEGVCLRSVDDGPNGAIGYLHTQWEQCAQHKFASGGSFDRMARCDESQDCAEGAACCEQFLFSGSDGMAECTALAPSGATPCDFGERCIEGSPCRTPGTQCVRGICEKPVVGQRCGDARCGADAPYCCAGQGCSADPRCDGKARIACASTRDCVAGARCIDDELGGTYCTKTHPYGDQAPWICGSDRDCRGQCKSLEGTRPRCVQASTPWLARCGCRD